MSARAAVGGRAHAGDHGGREGRRPHAGAARPRRRPAVRRPHRPRRRVRPPAPIRISLVWGSGRLGPPDGDGRAPRPRSTRPSLSPSPPGARPTTDGWRSSATAREASGSATVSLMPADNVQGWRADTLARLRELNSPVYRWPGGNFVSGYDWKDGIGDPDRRPPRKNPAWKGIESNDVGIDEFMVLCRELGTEPFIAVNTGLGGVEAAAEELEYMNGAPTSPMGRRRAENGHPQPYGVKWWGIGNEMYGDWQLGHMPLADYLKKHNRVVDAMRAVDATIVPIAVGAVGDWSKADADHAPSRHMGLLSEHTYWQNKPDGARPRRAGDDGHPQDRGRPPRLSPRAAVAQGQGHPHRPRRVELLVRPQRIRRAGHAVLPPGRAGRRRRPPRDVPQQRPLLHGELRPDRQRHRRHQDHGDRGRAGDDGPRPASSIASASGSLPSRSAPTCGPSTCRPR